jgi:adenylate cyclase
MADEAGFEFREVLQGLGTAVVVADIGSGSIVFENARFFQWFQPLGGADERLDNRVPDLDLARAVERVRSERPFQQELSIESGGTEVPLRVAAASLGGDGDFVVFEFSDISKEKQVQYMLDSYSKMAERNARDLEKEKERVERLLLNIMPRSVVDELQEYGTATPQHFDRVSIVMLDFVGFTDMTVAQDPSATISELNDIFSAFDRIVEMFGCERLRTVGDAYMAVSGVPDANPTHAENIARVALRMRRYLERRNGAGGAGGGRRAGRGPNAAHPQQWLARIGIHTGPVIGSLVGIQKYVYDLFGPGVNFAARMESMSEPMGITCNAFTKGLLEDQFSFTPRGEFEIKGFGSHELFFLESELGTRA